MVHIINIIGAPCSGKSTLACELFVFLKKKHLNVEYVNEFVKNLIWEDNLDDINDQYYVAKNQYKIIKNVSKKVDYIICDSPLFNSLFYNMYNKNNISNVEKTKEFILEKMNELQEFSVYIFLNRNKEFPFFETGRIHNSNESNEIECFMKKMLRDLYLDFYEINPDTDLKLLMSKLSIDI